MQIFEKEIFFEKAKNNTGALKHRTTKKISDARLEELLKFIHTFVKKHSYAPTVREMMACVNVTSTATIQYYLNKLEERGLITRRANKKRTLEVVKDAFAQELQAESNKKSNITLQVPYVGNVAAGEPILAQENFLDNYELPKNLISGQNLFMLRISGNSMRDAGILDGDKVIVEQNKNANNGDIVVAMIDGSATVKTFFKEKDCIRLQPENPAFDPIYSKHVEILGKVIGLFRKM